MMFISKMMRFMLVLSPCKVTPLFFPPESSPRQLLQCPLANNPSAEQNKEFCFAAEEGEKDRTAAIL
jgi:hypothetical protein